jgi:thioredoxin 1
MLAPVVEQVAAEIGDKVKIVGANVDEAPESAGNAGIMSIPALVFYKGGQEVHRIVGVPRKDVLLGEIRKRLLS